MKRIKLLSIFLVLVLTNCARMETPIETSKAKAISLPSKVPDRDFPYLKLKEVSWASDSVVHIQTEFGRYTNSNCVIHAEKRFVEYAYLILSDGSIFGIDRRNMRLEFFTANSVADLYSRTNSYSVSVANPNFNISSSEDIKDLSFLVLLTDGLAKYRGKDYIGLAPIETGFRTARCEGYNMTTWQLYECCGQQAQSACSGPSCVSTMTECESNGGYHVMIVTYSCGSCS